MAANRDIEFYRKVSFESGWAFSGENARVVGVDAAPLQETLQVGDETGGEQAAAGGHRVGALPDAAREREGDAHVLHLHCEDRSQPARSDEVSFH